MAPVGLPVLLLEGVHQETVEGPHAQLGVVLLRCGQGGAAYPDVLGVQWHRRLAEAACGLFGEDPLDGRGEALVGGFVVASLGLGRRAVHAHDFSLDRLYAQVGHRGGYMRQVALELEYEVSGCPVFAYLGSQLAQVCHAILAEVLIERGESDSSGVTGLVGVRGE